MCIPSISENVARKVLEAFGSLSQLQDALRSGIFPQIWLDARTFLGKARRAKLAAYLLGRHSDSMKTDSSVPNRQLAVAALGNTRTANHGTSRSAHNSMAESMNYLMVPSQNKVNCRQTSVNSAPHTLAGFNQL